MKKKYELLDEINFPSDLKKLPESKLQKVADELREEMIDAVKEISYAEAFYDYAEIDILNSDFEGLKNILESHGLNSDYEWIEDIQMVLFVHLIEPQLKTFPVCFIYDFPKQQAALAQIDGLVAHRFEMYIKGTEIANGYQEIQTSKEYRDRFETELGKRKSLSKSIGSLDEDFLDDLKVGLPSCSGVAIGIDRLFTSLSL